MYIHIYIYIYIHREREREQGNPHIRESRIASPARPGMQAAGLLCLKAPDRERRNIILYMYYSFISIVIIVFS